MFDEVQFESPPKRSFQEPDIQDFRDYIIPQSSGGPTIPTILTRTNQSSPLSCNTSPINSKTLQKRKLTNAGVSTDSSSESDYDYNKVSKKRSPVQKGIDNIKKKLKLPELSPIVSEDESQSIIPTSKQHVTTKIQNIVDFQSDQGLLNKELQDVSKESVDNKNADVCNTSNNELLEDTNKTTETLLETNQNKTNIKEDMLPKCPRKDAIIILDEVGACDSFVDISDNELSDDTHFSNFDDVGNDLQLVNTVDKVATKFHKKSECKKRETFADFWTDDMKKFYSESWGHESIKIEDILKTMSGMCFVSN